MTPSPSEALLPPLTCSLGVTMVTTQSGKPTPSNGMIGQNQLVIELRDATHYSVNHNKLIFLLQESGVDFSLGF